MKSVFVSDHDQLVAGRDGKSCSFARNPHAARKQMSSSHRICWRSSLLHTYSVSARPMRRSPSRNIAEFTPIRCGKSRHFKEIVPAPRSSRMPCAGAQETLPFAAMQMRGKNVRWCPKRVRSADSARALALQGRRAEHGPIGLHHLARPFADEVQVILERRHAEQFRRDARESRRTDRSAATSPAPGPVAPGSSRSAARSGRRPWSGCSSPRTPDRDEACCGVFS